MESTKDPHASPNKRFHLWGTPQYNRQDGQNEGRRTSNLDVEEDIYNGGSMASAHSGISALSEEDSSISCPSPTVSSYQGEEDRFLPGDDPGYHEESIATRPPLAMTAPSISVEMAPFTPEENDFNPPYVTQQYSGSSLQERIDIEPPPHANTYGATNPPKAPPEIPVGDQKTDNMLLDVVTCLVHQENCHIPRCPCREVKQRFQHLMPQMKEHMAKEAGKVVDDVQSGRFDQMDRRQQMRLSISSQNFSPDIHAHYHMTSRSHLRQSDNSRNNRFKLLQRRRSRSIDLTPVMEQLRESCATTPNVMIPDSPSTPSANQIAPPFLLREISLSDDNLPALCLNDCPMAVTPLMALGNRPLGSSSPLVTAHQQWFDENLAKEEADKQRAIDEVLYWDTLSKGYVKSGKGLVMLVGVTGSGKSEFKRLVLDQEVPEFSLSTPLAEAAVRSMSVCHVAARGVDWIPVGPQMMIEMVACTIESILQQMKQEKEESVPASPRTVEKGGEESSQSRVEMAKKESFCQKYRDALQEVHTDTELLNQMTASFGAEVKKLMDVDFIYMLDSGGQPPFREMLPHFVQQASAIVLMQKLNERLDFRPIIRYREEGGKVDKGYISQLTNEQILHQYVQGVQSHKSKVFVVGTHRDKETECKEETRVKKDKKLLAAFRPVLGKQMELYKVGKPDKLMFPVDCRSRTPEEKEMVKEFRERVMEKCLGEKIKIPLPWFILEQLLQLLAQKMEVSVFSIEECCEAAKCKLQIDRNNCEAALRYLGKLNIIYYRPDILPGIVFSNAQVILDKLTELVRCCHALRTEETANEDGSQVPSYIHSTDGLRFREYGLLDSELLEKAFPSHYREGFFSSPNFLLLLERLLIAGRLNNGEHFISSLLPDLPVDKVAEYRATANHPPPLVIYYPKMWLPVGLTSSLVVYLQNNCGWEPSEKDGTPTCMYHNCFQFKLPGGKPGSVVLIDSTKFLEINLKCSHKTGRVLCPKMREHILAGLRDAHKSLHYDPPKTELGFLCSGDCGKAEPHLATLDANQESWLCSEDFSIGGDLSDQQTLWLSSVLDCDDGLCGRVAPKTYIGKDDLHQVRTIIQPATHRWKQIGLALRLDLGQLKKIEKQYRDLDDCLIEMLSLWLNQNYNTETFGKPSWELLAKAIEAHCGGNDCALSKEIRKIAHETIQRLATIALPSTDGSTTTESLSSCGSNPL